MFVLIFGGTVQILETGECAHRCLTLANVHRAPL
jgi:hypothetical protein